MEQSAESSARELRGRDRRNSMSITSIPTRTRSRSQDVRKRFKVEAAPAPDGRMVADAIVIVAKGDRHWFLTPRDMVEVAPGDDVKAKPREEQALTGAIRRVVAGDKTKLCFMTGHGERSIEDGSEEGLGLLRDVLDKDNYESDERRYDAAERVRAVQGMRRRARRRAAAASGARSRRARAMRRRRGFARTSSRAATCSLAIGAEAREAAPAFAKVLEPFGIALDDLLVIEGDPTLAFPNARGDTFVALPKTSPITTGLVPTRRDARRAEGRPRRRAAASSRDDRRDASTDLLATSDRCVRGERRARQRRSRAPRRSTFRTNAGTRSRRARSSSRWRAKAMKATKDAPHGPRVVVVGSSYAFATSNFRAPLPWHGTAFLMGNAIAWLSAKPAVLDVPDKPSVGAGLRMSAEAERRSAPLRAPLHADHRARARRARRGAPAHEYGRARRKKRHRRSDLAQARDVDRARARRGRARRLALDGSRVGDRHRARRASEERALRVSARRALAHRDRRRARRSSCSRATWIATPTRRGASSRPSRASPTRTPSSSSSSAFEFATFVRKVEPKAAPTFDCAARVGLARDGQARRTTSRSAALRRRPRARRISSRRREAACSSSRRSSPTSS